MRKYILSTMVLFGYGAIVGMQKEERSLSSLVALKNKNDQKAKESLKKTPLEQCERCHKYNAIHRHPDVWGYMCADCSNERALFVLEMVLGPCESSYSDYNKDPKK